MNDPYTKKFQLNFKNINEITENYIKLFSETEDSNKL
jgi:hypothetical protein